MDPSSITEQLTLYYDSILKKSREILIDEMASDFPNLAKTYNLTPNLTNGDQI